jgi:hypothetical protein
MPKAVPLYVTDKGRDVLADEHGIGEIVVVATCTCGRQWAADHEDAARDALYEHIHESEAPA